MKALDVFSELFAGLTSIVLYGAVIVFWLVLMGTFVYPNASNRIKMKLVPELKRKRDWGLFIMVAITLSVCGLALSGEADDIGTELVKIPVFDMFNRWPVSDKFWWSFVAMSAVALVFLLVSLVLDALRAVRVREGRVCWVCGAKPVGIFGLGCPHGDSVFDVTPYGWSTLDAMFKGSLKCPVCKKTVKVEKTGENEYHVSCGCQEGYTGAIDGVLEGFWLPRLLEEGRRLAKDLFIEEAAQPEGPVGRKEGKSGYYPARACRAGEEV